MSNVIDFPTSMDPHSTCVAALQEALKFVEENPDTISACAIVITDETVATFKTPDINPFMFLTMLEIIRAKYTRTVL